MVQDIGSYRHVIFCPRQLQFPNKPLGRGFFIFLAAAFVTVSSQPPSYGFLKVHPSFQKEAHLKISEQDSQADCANQNV
ncbi:hypothetical protein L249_2300 [Ophiocordyceps polyrhachis-furcata BCC 54312]|uniref:Uncharacterized protein n=1 Tax=Ophiocordyceps polyrhachis-furcata BCC 54312 TaxID=1330021 RepID=A0A367LRG6_9HYPO|nr:hypothetical protein L249_2300 [Ophiocordyceps polyrhachis-furcata BCC 54312]